MLTHARLSIGSRASIVKKAKARVKELRNEFPNASVYGLEEFGGLGVITVLRDKPAKYGLPEGDKAKPIELSKAEALRDTYKFFSLFSFGLPSVKRAAFKIARSFTNSGNKKA